MAGSISEGYVLVDELDTSHFEVVDRSGTLSREEKLSLFAEAGDLEQLREVLGAASGEPLGPEERGAALVKAVTSEQWGVVDYLLKNDSPETLLGNDVYGVIAMAARAGGQWPLIECALRLQGAQEMPPEVAGEVLCHAAEARQEGVMQAVLELPCQKMLQSEHLLRTAEVVGRELQRAVFAQIVNLLSQREVTASEKAVLLDVMGKEQGAAGLWESLEAVLALKCSGDLEDRVVWSLLARAAKRGKWEEVELILRQSPRLGSNPAVLTAGVAESLGSILAEGAEQGRRKITESVFEMFKRYPPQGRKSLGLFQEHVGRLVAAYVLDSQWKAAEECLAFGRSGGRGHCTECLRPAMEFAVQKGEWALAQKVVREFPLDGKTLNYLLREASKAGKNAFVKEILKAGKVVPLDGKIVGGVLRQVAKEGEWDVVTSGIEAACAPQVAVEDFGDVALCAARGGKWVVVKQIVAKVGARSIGERARAQLCNEALVSKSWKAVKERLMMLEYSSLPSHDQGEVVIAFAGQGKWWERAPELLGMLKGAQLMHKHLSDFAGAAAKAQAWGAVLRVVTDHAAKSVYEPSWKEMAPRFEEVLGAAVAANETGVVQGILALPFSNSFSVERLRALRRSTQREIKGLLSVKLREPRGE